MGKRNRDETEEQRKERKRLKKEAKKKKKKEQKKEAKEQSRNAHLSSAPAASSVFYKKRLELTVSLLPAGLGNVLQSIEDSLSLFLLKYSDGIGGILLAFDNVEVLDKGIILHELPHIHYSVACNALVFLPSVGSQLTGVVTESFHSHLSLVVHHYFNASISAEHLRQAGFEFNDVELQWHRTKDSSELTKGVQVDFVVEKIHESGGIISIDGTKPCISAELPVPESRDIDQPSNAE